MLVGGRCWTVEAELYDGQTQMYQRVVLRVRDSVAVALAGAVARAAVGENPWGHILRDASVGDIQQGDET